MPKGDELLLHPGHRHGCEVNGTFQDAMIKQILSCAKMVNSTPDNLQVIHVWPCGWFASGMYDTCECVHACVCVYIHACVRQFSVPVTLRSLIFATPPIDFLDIKNGKA